MESHIAKLDLKDNQKKWTLASTCAGFALEHMDAILLSFALSSIITDLHVSTGEAGFISTISLWGGFVGGVLFGLIGDRYGRVKTFTYTIFIFALATGAMYFTQNIYQIYFVRFIVGIGTGGEYGVGIALLTERFPKKEIGRVSSIASIGGQIGSILAAIFAAIIIPLYGWRALFLVGLLPIGLVYFIRRHVKETPEFIARKKTNISIVPLFKNFSTTIQTLLLVVMVTVQIAGYYGLMNWLPSIMQKQLKISVSHSSIWMVTTIIGMIIGMQSFGIILDKLGPRMAFGIFLIGSAISVFAIIFAFNMLTMIISGMVLGFFSNGMYGGYGAIISALYPPEIRSTANNLIMKIGGAIGGLSSVVIGILMEHFSLIVVMGFLSAMYLVSLVAMLSIPALRHHKFRAE